MRRTSIALAVALASSACAGPSGLLDEYSRESAEVTTSSVPVSPATDQADREVVEHSCFDESSDRCGRVLVPQVLDGEGPIRRIAIDFRISQVDEPGRPVLLLTGSRGLLHLDDLDLPGRPLIELASRGTWPSQPALRCPEMGWLPTDADNHDWSTVIEQCAARLAASGVDVGSYDSRHRAADAARALTLLGYDRVDVIAVGRAALDVAAADDDSWIEGVLHVQPAAPGELAANVVAAQQRLLEHVWEICEDAPGCRLHGSVTDFLDVIATLAADPIVLSPVNGASGGDDRVLDDVDWIDRTLSDSHDPVTALFLPQLHRALRDRDTEWLGSYVEASPGSVDAANFTSYCAGLLRSDPAAVAGMDLHPVFTRWMDDTRQFGEAFCDAWDPDLVAPAVDRLRHDALSVVAAGGPGADPADLAASGAEVLVAATVARPGAACVSAAALAWFDNATITDDPACGERPSVVDREAPLDLVAGHYEYTSAGSTVVVTTVVPDGWHDLGYGTWSREADPLDRTSLDIYVLTEMNSAGAQDWFVTSWDLIDPTTEIVAVGDRDWSLVTAVDPWSTGEQRYRAAFTEEGGVVVGVILWTAAAELDGLTNAVLRPALDAVTVTG